LVTPAALRAIETVTTNYNIIEILGENRNNVYLEIEQALSERFEEDGVTLHSITFLDTDAGASIEAAIEAEAAAKKEVDIAEQKRVKAEIEKQEAIIRAEAEKEQKILQAQGEAESIRIIQEQLAKDPTYIDYIKWSNWDGALPEVLGESDILLNR
jgi:regulator of protease activity HflC (stomatin/prohibitin superfamily)